MKNFITSNQGWRKLTEQVFIIHFYVFRYQFTLMLSLAKPSRFVGRKPHRYNFASLSVGGGAGVGAMHSHHGNQQDDGLEQVKVYLNSSHSKGNGAGPGATYNKVICCSILLLEIYFPVQML